MLSPSECPLIGINGLLDPGETPRLNLPLRYAEAIQAAGGIPVALPPCGGPSDIERVLDRLDGILLSGGDDFDTASLGLGPTHPEAVLTPASKQDFDFALAESLAGRDLPVLGICYGLQLLNLAAGGDLHQHLPQDRPECGEHRGNVRHAVQLEPDTKLARILGVRELDVISRHHQALSKAGRNWNVSARDSEGLIEAVERADHPFTIGVQWHPELSSPGHPDDRLFRGLVSAASLFAARRDTPHKRAQGALEPARIERELKAQRS